MERIMSTVTGCAFDEPNKAEWIQTLREDMRDDIDTRSQIVDLAIIGLLSLPIEMQKQLIDKYYPCSA